MSSSLPRKQALACVLAASLPITLSFSRAQESAPPPAPAPPGADANAAAYVEYGTSDGKRGDLDGAIKAFETAIKLDPKFAPAYYDLGFAKQLQGKTDEAIQDYGKTLAVDPNYMEAYNRRGNLRGSSGDFTDAIADFQQVVRISPELPAGHYNLGHAYYFTGDLDKSSAELDTALTLDPKYALAYYIRGIVRHAQGHSSEATGDFRKSLGFNFSHAALWIFICESEDGFADTASKDLADALKLPDVFQNTYFSTDIANFLLGYLPQDQLLAKAQAANPTEQADDTCAAWFYAGVVQRLAGKKTEARDCFNKAIATKSVGSEEYTEAQREIATLAGL